jgi:TPR repeat protein
MERKLRVEKKTAEEKGLFWGKIVMGVALVASVGFGMSQESFVIECYNKDLYACRHINAQTIAKLQKRCLERGDDKACFIAGKALREQKKYKEALEFSKKACEEGRGGGCVSLAGLYYYGKGVKFDYRKALSLYKKACDLGYGLGCTNMGYMYGKGRWVRRNLKKTFALYKRACELGDELGCNNLGHLYYNGIGVKKDIKKGGALFKKACKMGSRVGCSNWKRVRFFVK